MVSHGQVIAAGTLFSSHYEWAGLMSLSLFLLRPIHVRTEKCAADFFILLSLYMLAMNIKRQETVWPAQCTKI